MSRDYSDCLLSPVTGRALEEKDGELVTTDETERFEIRDHIACLIDREKQDVFKNRETLIFSKFDITGIPYFRKSLFTETVQRILSLRSPGLFPEQEEPFLVVEMGGGEGHWARTVKEAIPRARVFTCDMSLKALSRAPRHLNKVCADMTHPVFRKESVHLAAFWVSLHHLPLPEQSEALKNTAAALAPGGLLLLFEPNIFFWPRHLIYRTPLRREVYPDDKERALDFFQISETLERNGLKGEEISFMNPPYHPDFLHKFDHGALYRPVLESLYQIERKIVDPLLGRQSPVKKYLSLYGFAVYRKGERRTDA